MYFQNLLKAKKIFFHVLMELNTFGVAGSDGEIIFYQKSIYPTKN